MTGAPLQIGTGHGCEFNLDDALQLCSKVCDAGEKFCPFHLMLVEHNKTMAAKKEKAKHEKKIADIRRKARR